MLIRVTMKTPDAVDDAIIDAVEDIEDEEERHTAKERARKVCGRFFQYGEYVTILVDTEKGTCTVEKV